MGVDRRGLNSRLPVNMSVCMDWTKLQPLVTSRCIVGRRGDFFLVIL